VAITFEPHPKMILHPERRPFYLITSLEEKIRLVAAAGVDILILIPFSLEYAQTTADEFIRDVLWERLRIRKILPLLRNRFIRHRRKHAAERTHRAEGPLLHRGSEIGLGGAASAGDRSRGYPDERSAERYPSPTPMTHGCLLGLTAAVAAPTTAGRISPPDQRLGGYRWGCERSVIYSLRRDGIVINP
jgi:hypothetical protein